MSSVAGLRCPGHSAKHLTRPPHLSFRAAALAAEEAWSLLQEFSAKEARGLAQAFLDSRDKRQRLRDALLVRSACLCSRHC